MHINFACSYGHMLLRDLQRLRELYTRVDLCPLGCGALAGNPFNVDRNFIATGIDGLKVIRSNCL